MIDLQTVPNTVPSFLFGTCPSWLNGALTYSLILLVLSVYIICVYIILYTLIGHCWYCCFVRIVTCSIVRFALAGKRLTIVQAEVGSCSWAVCYGAVETTAWDGWPISQGGILNHYHGRRDSLPWYHGRGRTGAQEHGQATVEIGKYSPRPRKTEIQQWEWMEGGNKTNQQRATKKNLY